MTAPQVQATEPTADAMEAAYAQIRASFLLICICLADTNEAEAAHEEAQQQQQEQHAAAHEAQP